MDIISLICIFVVGIFIGSFLNLVIDRLYLGGQIVFGRSHCGSCHKTLSLKDLVPIFSYLFLFGKCRYCKKAIEWINPVVELVTGVSFIVAIVFSNLSNFGYLGVLCLVCIFIVIFFADLKYGVVYSEVIGLGVVATLLIWVLGGIWEIREVGINLAGALGAFLFFWILHKVFKGRAMGRGDADIAFLVGVTVGFPQVLVALFSSFLTGAVFGIILIIVKAKGLKDKIPFGPFLVLGVLVSLFAGNGILSWYKGLLSY
jgi:leader peptidase (prepilin peptidase)/N-methyltransferase